MLGVEPDAPAVILDDLAAHRQPDAGARVGLLGVQALEDHEDPLRVLRLDADAVVGAAQLPRARRRGSPSMRTSGASAPRNLIALPIRFWNSDTSSVRSPRTAGQLARLSRCAPLSSSSADSDASACASSVVEVDELELAAAAPDAREREQVVDQHLHALGAVDRELDVLVGALVELAVVAALQRLAEARDLAQRLLQVVRGDVGELLELGVGAVAARAPAPRSCCARGSTLASSSHDALAHRVDLAAELHDLARAAPLTPTGLSNSPRRDLLGFASERRERAGDDPAQQEAGSEHAAEDQRGGDEQHDLQEARVAFELAAALA